MIKYIIQESCDYLSYLTSDKDFSSSPVKARLFDTEEEAITEAETVVSAYRYGVTLIIQKVVTNRKR